MEEPEIGGEAAANPGFIAGIKQGAEVFGAKIKKRARAAMSTLKGVLQDVLGVVVPAAVVAGILAIPMYFFVLRPISQAQAQAQAAQAQAQAAFAAAEKAAAAAAANQKKAASEVAQAESSAWWKFW